MKNIVLIGYMGGGKSTIARELSKRLSMQFVDLDDYIEAKEKNTISQIFETRGEIYFRKLETQCLKECLTSLENTIISLGGGTPCFGTNMEFINTTSNAMSIYLRTSVVALNERLFTQKAKRPIIAHLETPEDLQEFIGKHLFERNPFYTQAQYIVETTGRTVAEVCEEVIAYTHTNINKS